MKSYKAQGIVLNTIKYGDSSLVVYMLTNTLGRQTYMVQGVRSKKGNKNALFQPMFVIEFEGLQIPRAEMHRMKDARNFLHMSSMPFDVRKSTIALFMAEVLYRLIREVEPNSNLFDFVHGAVIALDEMDAGVANFHLWFLVKLSYFIGFYPGNEYVADGWFDIREGIFTEYIPDHGMVMSQENTQLLYRIISCRAEDLHELKLSRTQRVDFLNSLLYYLGYHLDTINSIRSINILREVF